MQKILTVIIPAYNCEKYIERCLDSLRHPEVNVIINIDGGSSDATPEIVEKYCQLHPNFSFINSPHQGAMSAVKNV